MTVWVILLVLLVVGGAGFAVRRGLAARHVRQLEEAGSFRLSRRAADEDVTRLGEELAELHFETLTTDLDPDMRADYQQALEAYETSKQQVRDAERGSDVTAVTSTLEDGRFAMACVLARRDGEELPDGDRRASSTRRTGRRARTSRGRLPAAWSARFRSASIARRGSSAARNPTYAWCGGATGTCRGGRPGRPTGRTPRATTATIWAHVASRSFSRLPRSREVPSRASVAGKAGAAAQASTTVRAAPTSGVAALGNGGRRIRRRRWWVRRRRRRRWRWRRLSHPGG